MWSFLMNVAEVGTIPDNRSRLRQDSAFLLQTRTLSKTFGKPDLDPVSLFNIDSSRILCGHIGSKTSVN